MTRSEASQRVCDIAVAVPSTMWFDIPSSQSTAADEMSELNTSYLELQKQNVLLNERVSDEKPPC